MLKMLKKNSMIDCSKRARIVIFFYRQSQFEGPLRLRTSEAEIQMRCRRAKRAWQNINVRSGYSKQHDPSFVPQSQISQKPLRKVMPLILHTQPMGCYWSTTQADRFVNGVCLSANESHGVL